MDVKYDPLLSRIEAALIEHDISATKLGYVVAGDPALVGKLRKGRNMRNALRCTVEAALARLEKEGKL